MKQRYIILLALLVCLPWLHRIHAQDVQLSQFYASPMLINPAFTGSAHMTRATVHQRIQWPSLAANFYTTYVGVDTWFDKARSGVGVMAMHDMQGSNTISGSELHLMYAYELPLNEKYSIRMGGQFGLVSRYMNYGDLFFPSQFDDRDGLVIQNNGYDNQRTFHPDVSLGSIFYGDRIWGGFSAHHVNVPNYSFEGEVSRWPIRWAWIAGYKIPLEKPRRGNLERVREMALIPAINFKMQGKNDQTDIGMYALIDQAMVGMWYRGIPFKRYKPSIQNNESIVLLAGAKIKKFLSLSYSYDITISKLTPARSGGSHEINITWYNDMGGKKKHKSIPCPDIYNHVKANN